MLRLVTPIIDEDVDVAVTVDEAARILGCSSMTVRELVQKRRLAGHRVGTGVKPRGVRVSLASLKAYKERHAIGGTDGGTTTANDEPAPRRWRSSSPAHREAVARARAIGIL